MEFGLFAKTLKSEERKIENFEWGTLTWYVSKELGNSELITAGICTIKPGCSNPRHLHPNCEEILYVQEGEIFHSYGEDSGSGVSLNGGCSISIPSGILHNAKNVCESDAVLLILFSSAERQTISPGGS